MILFTTPESIHSQRLVTLWLLFQLMYQGYECRAAQSDCDLSEFCSGEDAFCPSDVHTADWTECTVEQVNEQEPHYH